MSNSSRATTFVTESATHKTVTVIKSGTEIGMKKPSIRGMVKAAFENGTARATLIAQIGQFHPTAAGFVKANKHINWYHSKMQGEWTMTGCWAPKTAPTELTIEATPAAGCAVALLTA